ncbi:MAG: recombinase family protein [Oscillospiraceae bacterium]|nr:recombinase family protein [Oscillospiraceae bacterium]
MKVAIYCRLSEEDRNKRTESDDSESIQNQKSMLVKYAVERDWEIYHIYSDDDYTGADRNRPDFNRLIQDAEACKFDIILCKSQSRFTRELEMVEKYIHDLFPIWGVRFISVVDNADTAVKGNKKARQINGLINEWYLEDLSENIKSVFKAKKENGVHIGSFALYGYMKNPEKKGHLMIDEEAADVVREVFSLFIQGYGKSAIARILNDRGIPNPTEYKRLKGLRYCQAKSRNSTFWRYFSISDMLTNEMYIGNMVQGRYKSVSYKSKITKPVPKDEWVIIPDTHEPIIERGQWNIAQELIKNKTKPFSDTGKIGLFAKKAKCLNCDYTMVSAKNHGKHYLKCGTRNIAKDSCIGSFVPVSELEKIVLSELHKLIDEYLNKSELLRRIELNTKIQANIDKTEKTLRTYEKSFSDCSKAVKDLYLDKTRGIITEDDFISLSKDFHSEKGRFERLIKQTIEALGALNERVKNSDDKSALLSEYLKVEKLTREHVNALIECIYIGKRNPETKELPLEIHWNF